MNRTKIIAASTSLLLFALSGIAFSQSGTRTFSAGNSGTGSALGSGASYSGGGGSGSGLQRAFTPQEAALRGQAALLEAAGQTTLLNSQAQRNWELARSNYLDNIRKIEELKYDYRQQKLRDKAILKETWAARRMKREMDRADQLANQRIEWPKALQSKRYDGNRNEIEELTRLYTRFQTSEAIEVGLKKSIELLAKEIKVAEAENRISETDSRIVRAFVTDLYRSNGQTALRPLRKKAMVAKN